MNDVLSVVKDLIEDDVTSLGFSVQLYLGKLIIIFSSSRSTKNIAERLLIEADEKSNTWKILFYPQSLNGYTGGGAQMPELFIRLAKDLEAFSKFYAISSYVDPVRVAGVTIKIRRLTDSKLAQLLLYFLYNSRAVQELSRVIKSGGDWTDYQDAKLLSGNLLVNSGRETFEIVKKTVNLADLYFQIKMTTPIMRADTEITATRKHDTLSIVSFRIKRATMTHKTLAEPGETDSIVWPDITIRDSVEHTKRRKNMVRVIYWHWQHHYRKFIEPAILNTTNNGIVWLNQYQHRIKTLKNVNQLVSRLPDTLVLTSKRGYPVLAFKDLFDYTKSQLDTKKDFLDRIYWWHSEIYNLLDDYVVEG